MILPAIMPNTTKMQGEVASGWLAAGLACAATLHWQANLLFSSLAVFAQSANAGDVTTLSVFHPSAQLAEMSATVGESSCHGAGYIYTLDHCWPCCSAWLSSSAWLWAPR